jgi:ABC-type cobalamin transport system permease subunit
MRLTRADKQLFIGSSFRLSLMIGGIGACFPHVARVCMSTRTHLCWDPVQQLLKEA